MRPPLLLDTVPGLPDGPWFTGLHVAADLLIGQSYVVIAGLLAFLVYRARRAIPFHWMFLAFGTFIVACGIGHFLHVVLLLRPAWWGLYAGVQGITVVASVATAALMPPLLPKAFALISIAQQAEQHRALLAHRAFHDPLTDLPNRALFLERLQQALLRAARQPGAGTYAVLFLDLDRFKEVNDTLGHATGDQLLIAFARLLQANLRAGDTAARFGGDEFAILLEPTGDEQGVRRVAERIQRQVGEPFRIGEREVRIGTSIGIVLGAPDYLDPAAVLRDADLALYRAKAAGRGGQNLFKAERPGKSASHASAGDAGETAEQDDRELRYRPIVALASGSTVGFEAIEYGDAPAPGDRNDATDDWWALRAACRQAHAWSAPEDAGPSLSVSVTLPARHFARAELIERVEEALEASALPPSRLRLQIGARTLADPAVAANLDRLHALGVRLHLTEFGAAGAPLRLLRRFAIDAMLIEPEDHPDSAGDAAVLAATLHLAASLDIATIATGIETTAQAERLRDLGCAYGQGPLFDLPCPAAAPRPPPGVAERLAS